jgi:TolB protein
VVTIALALVGACIAEAAHPGQNGKIAFASSRDVNGEIFLMDANGANPTNFTMSGALESAPEWSPDGRTIAFVSDRDGDYEIFTAPTDGSAAAKQLTFNTVIDDRPSFSPDGVFLAFETNQNGNFDIYTMRARDGGLRAALAANSALADQHASWSPLGDRIIFESDRGNGSTIDVYSADLLGNAAVNLTPNTPLSNDWQPDWSPDGRTIAYTNTSMVSQIVTMGADGLGNKPLVSADLAGFPTWSPDGRKIAFQARVGGSGANFEIFAMNSDGSGQSAVTSNPAGDSTPSWQPIVPTPAPGAPPPAATPTVRLPTLLTGRLAHNFSFNTAGLVTLHRLSVFDMKRNSNVLVRCRRGCSVTKRKTVSGTGWNLRPLFLRKRITVPVAIEVRITKPGLTIGRYLRLDISKRNRRVRSLVTECRIAYPSRKITNCRRI